MATPSMTGGRSRAANANPLATTRASTVPGNRRRATSGKVCSNTSAHPKTNLPRGRPRSGGSNTYPTAGRLAATSASALSNTQALAGSRRDPPARSVMTRRYRHRTSVTSPHMRQPTYTQRRPPMSSTAVLRVTPDDEGMVRAWTDLIR
jgi:hypothetical protein